jgi:hypothetical protein
MKVFNSILTYLFQLALLLMAFISYTDLMELWVSYKDGKLLALGILCATCLTLVVWIQISRNKQLKG